MTFRLFPEKYGKLPLLWMIYFLFPIYFFLKIGGGYGALGLILIAIFIGLYRDIYWHPNRAFLDILLMYTLLVFMIFYFHEGMLYTGLYLGASLSFVTERVKYWIGYGLALSLIGEIFLLDLVGVRDIEYSYVGAAMAMLIVIPIIDRYQAKWAETRHELKEANEKIAELVKQQERERIARDLHDTVGQTLSMITLKSEIANRMLTQDMERAEKEIQEITSISRSVLNQIREIVSDLKQLSIQEEVELTKQVLAQAQIKAEMNTTVSLSGVNQLYETILSYCLKEAVTNVIRHSGATECWISIQDYDNSVHMIVVDNGMGIQENKQGNGLAGMKERLDLINGQVSMENKGKMGLQVEVTIPKVQKDKQKVS